MCCKRYFSFYSYLKPVGELMENTINLNRQFKKKKRKDDPVYIKRPNSRLKSFYKVYVSKTFTADKKKMLP